MMRVFKAGAMQRPCVIQERRKIAMRKFNLVLAGLVLAGLAVFLAAEGAEAFCVYNNTSTFKGNVKIYVEQTGGHEKGRGFKVYIDRGGKECCNWQNKDCNKEGKWDSIVKFTVTAISSGAEGETTYTVCRDFEIQAGGRLTVEGRKNRTSCVRHDDGVPIVPKP